MGQGMFLEEIGQIDTTNAIGSARAWEVRDIFNNEHLPPLIYVVESDAGERFLLGRELSGRAKFNLIRYIAKSFVEIFFERLKGKEAVQYLLLPEAYPLDLQYAIGVAPPYDRVLLPTEFVTGTKGPAAGVEEVPIRNKGGIYRGRTWLIPQTTLTSEEGTAHFLRNAFSSHRPEEIYLLAACGSLKGIEQIYQECRKEGVRLVPVVSQCLFEASQSPEPACSRDRAFPILNGATLATRTFFEKAAERYQGRRICAVGDVRKSLHHPVAYSVETLWEMMRVGMDPAKENWEAWTIDVRREEIRQKIEEFNPAVLEYFRASWE